MNAPRSATAIVLLTALCMASVLMQRPCMARAAAVAVPLDELGYRDGVTVAGVAPRVTFDLPNYASLRAAALDLEVHVSPNADPASTITVTVEGRPVTTRSLRALAGMSRLHVALPIPARTARTFAIGVQGALRVAGDPCATGTARSLFMRVGRGTAIVLQTASGGAAEAFFRDYRGALDVTGAVDDPRIAAVPYQLDRLEPWHRITATLVARPRPDRRTLVFTRRGPTMRRGDVLEITPAAFAALPIPLGQSPTQRDGAIRFGDLRQHLGTASGLGDLTFDVPLAASIVGGTPLGLHVHVEVGHSALGPGIGGTLQVLVNGVLVGARALGRAASTQTLDVAVPASVVAPSNDLRVLVATEATPAACAAGRNAVTASLLDASSFTWSGVEPRAATIESFLTSLHGRVIVLLTPAFAHAAFHVLSELGALNASIVQLDVARFAGRVPPGYDAALVFAPPAALGDLGLPIRTGAATFDVVNPTDDTSALRVRPATSLALLQLGTHAGTPLLALTYHGDPRSIVGIATVAASELATQVAPVTVIDGRGATAYDVGDKLRVRYAADASLAALWLWLRIGLTLALIGLIVAGAAYASRRLTGANVR